MVGGGRHLLPETFGSTDPRWSEIADFQPIFARSSSAVTPSEKVQLTNIGTRKPAENLSNSAKKRKIKAITALKVIQGHRGRYQSKARMRFPISD